MTFVPLALLGAAILLLVIFFYYVPFLLWISAKVSGVNISLIQLFLMRIRNVPPYVITRAMIEAHKAGLKTLTRDELEAHYLAGGHVEKVVHALVSASKANIDLPFQMATAGRTRRIRSRTDVGQPESHRHASRYGRSQGWHPADRQSTRDSPGQYQTISRRSRRRDDSGPRW